MRILQGAQKTCKSYWFATDN